MSAADPHAAAIAAVRDAVAALALVDASAPAALRRAADRATIDLSGALAGAAPIDHLHDLRVAPRPHRTTDSAIRRV